MTDTDKHHPANNPEHELPGNGEAQAASAQVAVEQGSAAELGAQVAQLRSDLEHNQAKANEYLDGWQRSRAEFANYKRRIERDQAQQFQMTVGNVVRRYLTIVDDLERALRDRPQGDEGAAWANGIELIYRKLLAALEADGVRVMDAHGQMFDPVQHEAIMQEPSPDHASGQIIDVLQNGYLIGDRVLRPAIVRVAE